MNDDEFAELFKKLSSGQSTGTSWQDVVAEFEALGRTLSEVLRRAWEGTDSESAVGRLREVVADAVEDLNRAVDGSPEATQAREQLVELRDSLSGAVERAGSELRPELLKLLRQANAELRHRSGLTDQT
jgi:ElaB/YqjD/DUF883 family membrane-anchored ribosome-binding protein